jgi:hypothetical protein
MIDETPVIFHSHGVPLLGRFLRNTRSLQDRQPAVIVMGSWLTVKEQMAMTYGWKLAEAGYTAFTFDFAGFGQSHGEPRQAEIPSRKIGDIQAAADFLRAMAFIDPDAVRLRLGEHDRAGLRTGTEPGRVPARPADIRRHRGYRDQGARQRQFQVGARRLGHQGRQTVAVQHAAIDGTLSIGVPAMTKTTLVRALVALMIVLLIAAASIIIIRSNADGAATGAETPGGFPH